MELRFVHIDSICEILLPEISIFVKNTLDILSNIIRYGQIIHAAKLLLLFDIAVDESSTNDCRCKKYYRLLFYSITRKCAFVRIFLAYVRKKL